MYGQGNKTIKDLPLLVQYAINDLIATNHIEGQVDNRLLETMLKLPEPIVLQALENFSLTDMAKVRSKGGYLFGILKKLSGRA